MNGTASRNSIRRSRGRLFLSGRDASLFAVVYWLLMPAWPLGSTYTKGLLGIDQRDHGRASSSEAMAERAPGTEQIEAADFADDPGRPGADADRARDRRHAVRRQLRGLPRRRRHGRAGLSRPDRRGVAVGRRARGDRRDDARRHQFRPPRDPGVADAGLRPRRDARPQRDRERGRLMSSRLSDRPRRLRRTRRTSRRAGRSSPTNCVACHGDGRQGNRARRARPDRRDWIYGGDRQSIYTTVYSGRQGHMPTWERASRRSTARSWRSMSSLSAR